MEMSFTGTSIFMLAIMLLLTGCSGPYSVDCATAHGEIRRSYTQHFCVGDLVIYEYAGGVHNGIISAIQAPPGFSVRVKIRFHVAGWMPPELYSIRPISPRLQ